MSCIKTLCNEMIKIEASSELSIPSDSCYIVKISFISQRSTPVSYELAELCLKSKPSPLIVYYSQSIILLLFASADRVDGHQCSGDHSKIISKYVQFICKSPFDLIDIQVFASIVHLTSTQVITYLSYIIFQTSKEVMMKLSTSPIDRELYFRTESELKGILEEQNIFWDDIDNHTKYGTLLKLKKKKDKIIIDKMSEKLDFRENKKYNNFIF